ncbi:MAG: cation-translocating P-type ATPase [Pyramidobacter sp.]|nr:cation-translocating P-type ATPase [Pyramidobacter sp.]
MSDEKKITKTLTVLGMSCSSCSRIVERSLSKVPGVAFAAVNLATNTAFAVLDEDIPTERLEDAVRKVGYEVSHEKPEDIEAARYTRSKRNMALAAAVTLPLMVMMGFHMAGTHFPGMTAAEIIGGAAAIFIAGRETLRGAWIAVTHSHANMDVLVSLGAVSAWLTSVLNACGLPVTSFGCVGPMIIALHLLGRYIESRLRDRAAREIRALIKIQSKDARLVLPEGELIVPIEALKAGQTVRILAGERIPADASVTSGNASVDESMLTGEPIPVAKSAGDSLTGGSVLVSGRVDASVTHTGEDSFLAKMIAVIQEAQGAKIPIQAFADRVTGIFVPGVVSLALASALFWYFRGERAFGFLDASAGILPWVTHLRAPSALAVFSFLSTLLIACPCALGLATPMALIAGTSAASRNGLIIRNAEAIQTIGQTTTAILDKTGTLTEGRPTVTRHTLSEEDLKIAASIEAGSSHPLAKAIVSLAPDVTPVSPVEEIPGEGICAHIDGKRWHVGRPSGSAAIEDLEKGRTVVEVTCDGVIRGHIALEDPLRPEAAEAVKRLIALGVTPVMATGDSEQAARRAAMAVGISEVRAGVHPEDKLEIVREYQAKGGKVLMMGDGINDAAALKGADVGVAVGSGSELAVDSADMVIVRGGAGSLVKALEISRVTYAVIRQNLFWAFAYNFVALPMAMANLLHPLIAEASMTLSSISVILNSQRICKSQ